MSGSPRYGPHRIGVDRRVRKHVWREYAVNSVERLRSGYNHRFELWHWLRPFVAAMPSTIVLPSNGYTLFTVLVLVTAKPIVGDVCEHRRRFRQLQLRPRTLWAPPSRIASRTRCSMNHAVFCVTPSARASSCEDVPFLVFARSQRAGSHCQNEIGLFLKDRPGLSRETRACNLCSARSCGSRMNCTAAEPQPIRGHATACGQRTLTKWAQARSGSEK